MYSQSEHTLRYDVKDELSDYYFLGGGVFSFTFFLMRNLDYQ